MKLRGRWEDMPLDLEAEDQSAVGGDILHVEDILTASAYRGKGVGTCIAKIMAQEAERVGVKHIVLQPTDTDAKNGA
jgi:GNAT superfamily N-acetyltransferase